MIVLIYYIDLFSKIFQYDVGTGVGEGEESKVNPNSMLCQLYICESCHVKLFYWSSA